MTKENLLATRSLESILKYLNKFLTQNHQQEPLVNSESYFSFPYLVCFCAKIHKSLSQAFPGSRRFKKPEPISKFFNGKHDSVAVGENIKSCPGHGYGSNDIFAALEAEIISEDCLTVDIYRPVKHYETSLPIFVWIHGGGLTTGTSAYYHFSRLARQDIIVAVVQYRLGVHGFMSSYSADGLTETPGNFGLLDQQAAIEFVHRNAKNLGGDPGNKNYICILVFSNY